MWGCILKTRVVYKYMPTGAHLMVAFRGCPTGVKPPNAGPRVPHRVEGFGLPRRSEGLWVPRRSEGFCVPLSVEGFVLPRRSEGFGGAGPIWAV